MEASAARSAAPPRRWARLVAVLAPAVVFIALLGFGLLRTDGPPGPGDDAPTFTAARLEGGGSLSLASLRGKPVVLNFWASWCEPCRDEAPMLNAAARRYGDRVQIVGVNIKDSVTDAVDFAHAYDYAFPSVVDSDGRIYDDYGLTGQPETFVIDADGRVFQHVQGPFLSEADLFGLIEGSLRSDG